MKSYTRMKDVMPFSGAPGDAGASCSSHIQASHRTPEAMLFERLMSREKMGRIAGCCIYD